MFNFIREIKSNLQLDKKFSEAEKNGFHPIDKEMFKKYNSFRPNGAKPIFCYLPFNSITFSFGGKAYVCGYNREIELGRYPGNSIDEIWNGKPAMKLRQHLYNNDLDFGCQHCKYFFDKGKFSNLRPLEFDKYHENTKSQFPTVFEFVLSNECNLECQMCHGDISSSIRKNRDKLPPLPMVYDEAFVEQLGKYIPHLKEAKFYGGEPFLISLYYNIWDKIKVLNPLMELFLITNGMHWNSKIERIVTELNFDLAVSIDALDKEKLERIRKNIVLEKLLDNIDRFSEICTRKGKNLSLSFTVQKDNWEELPRIIDLCNKVNAFIYVSYLEHPAQFALTDCTTDELIRIRDYMTQFSFPGATEKQRHNQNCFEDFKNYLTTYIENSEAKKYHDYRFENDTFFSSEENFRSAPATDLIPLSQEQWIEMTEHNYRRDNSFKSILPKEIFIQKIASVLRDFSPEEQAIVRGTMTNTGFSQILESTKRLPVEELKRLSKVQLGRYSHLNSIT